MSIRRVTVLRRVAAGFLVALCAATVIIATCATWMREQVLDSSRWAATAAAIGRDPALTDAVTKYLVLELDDLVRPEDRISELLPDRLDATAGPLAAELRGFITDQARTVVTSDLFQRTWVEANRLAHSQVVSLLRDENPAFTTRDGSVWLNLGPVFDTLLDDVSDRLTELVGRPAELPKPVDGLQIRLFDADQLATPRLVVRAIDVTPWLAWPVAVLLGAAAVGLSRRRHRAVIVLVLATTIGTAALRAGIEVADVLLVRSAAEDYRKAVSAVTGHALSGLRTFTSVELTTGLVAVALLMIARFGRKRQLGNLRPVNLGPVTAADTSATIDEWPSSLARHGLPATVATPRSPDATTVPQRRQHLPPPLPPPPPPPPPRGASLPQQPPDSAGVSSPTGSAQSVTSPGYRTARPSRRWSRTG